MVVVRVGGGERKEQQSLWQDTEKERTNPAKESSVKTRITSARPAFNFSKDKTRLVWQMFQDPCLPHHQPHLNFSFLNSDAWG